MRASAVVEKAGIPTATLVCDGFTGQAAAITPGLGVESLPIARIVGHVDGQTISSDTLWTEVYPRSSGGESLRRRMNVARTVARRWQNQAIAHSDRSKFVAP